MTLLYDGDCAFCAATAVRMLRWGHGGYAVVPWQRADLTALGVTREEAMSAVQRVDEGRVTSGAEAFSAALCAMGGLWGGAGRVLPGVRAVARRTYGLVARNRHWLPGSTDACRTD
ncbi:MAG: thiol-disulfide oxidoreductase DCC family protein [Propionibacteriaceae bacterium]